MATTQTRSVFCRARIRDGRLISDLESDCARGPLCETIELARRTRLWVLDREEDIVITRVDQRMGGDGAWHPTVETIVEWGVL